jgi:cytochrome P450
LELEGSKIEICWWFNPYKILKNQKKIHITFQCIDEVQLKDEFDKNDLLSRLITARDENAKLSTSELISNTGVFMIAGHETTSNTLQWSLFYIACNPEVQLKVQKECDSFNFSDKSTWEEYSAHFQYTKCVMNEALRLKTPAFLQIRNSLEDVSLDDFFIPKGVMKLISI